MEWENIKKDGSKIYVESSISLVKDPEDRIIGFRGVVRDITDRKELHEQLRTMAVTDQLTGLFNRRGFITLAEQQLRSADRTKKKSLLAFIDLDGMKRINDIWGHEEGDKALIITAKILKQLFRESDIVARIGGDEFAVLALDVSDAMKEVFLSRLKQQLAAYKASGDREYKLSLSIGTTLYDPANPTSLDKLMSQADKLMYDDKRKKTN